MDLSLGSVAEFLAVSARRASFASGLIAFTTFNFGCILVVQLPLLPESSVPDRVLSSVFSSAC